MPELPEVETTINGIKPYLLEQKIIDVIIRHTQLRFPIPKLLRKKILGHTVRNITRRAKYILFHFDHGLLIVHLGMSGRLAIVLTQSAPQKHDHVDFLFANHVCLRFRDPRRFGAILWSDEADATQFGLLKHLGQEPLSSAFNGEFLFQAAKNRKVAVKSFIMDSRIVVGVGNIYANEALFAAGIHPLKAAGTISLVEWQKLARSIKTVLKKAIKAGGTTLKDFATPGGHPGYFSVDLRVYGKQGQPCHHCKTILKSIRINQRSTVYCEQCQR